ncbi:MAG: mandelate racemase/muconate lactonizing enzyme family protein [Candidatus Tectomicrobia bacterium]
MKITGVKAIPLFVPLDHAVGAPISLPYAEQLAGVVFGGYRSTIVQVYTDEGLIGIGECMTRLAPKALQAIVEDLEPILRGRDPRETEVLWELLYGTMMNRGHTRGFFIEALSGIDIALWDLAGKAQGVPVYHLLGGKVRDRIEAYASSLRFRGLETTLQTARTFMERGFRAMKIKIGQNPHDPTDDLALVKAIRQEVGDAITLMVDVNCGYHSDVTTALRVGRRLEALDIYWYEEPLSPDHLEGYRTLAAALDMAVAAGEASFTRYDFRDLLVQRAVDIIQPNACRTGGLSEVRKIAAMSSAFHIPYAPHTGSCSAVAMAVGLHIATALPNFLTYEYMQSDWSKDQPNPLRHDLVREPIEVFADGYLAPPPNKPGLGIELNDEILHRYAVV